MVQNNVNCTEYICLISLHNTFSLLTIYIYTVLYNYIYIYIYIRGGTDPKCLGISMHDNLVGGIPPEKI